MEKKETYLHWVLFKGALGLKLLWGFSILGGVISFAGYVFSYIVAFFNYFIKKIDIPNSVFLAWFFLALTLASCLALYFQTDRELYYNGYMKDLY